MWNFWWKKLKSGRKESEIYFTGVFHWKYKYILWKCLKWSVVYVPIIRVLWTAPYPTLLQTYLVNYKKTELSINDNDIWWDYKCFFCVWKNTYVCFYKIFNYNTIKFKENLKIKIVKKSYIKKILWKTPCEFDIHFF